MGAFSETDEEKAVLDSDGREIGVVDGVRNGSAFVRPLAGVGSATRTALGWRGDDRDASRLQGARVGSTTNDEFRLEDP